MADLVAAVEPSVVTVLTDQGQGSGIIYSADGTIVTNNHVITGSRQIEVALATGDRLPAELLGTDPITDVAVLRVDGDGMPAAALDTELPRVGSLAVAIGSPLGFTNSVTAGIVSGLQRSIPGAATEAPALVDLIQTDAAISPGNSGGALVGADGRLIGMNVAYIPPEARAVSIGFAIPAATVAYVADAIVDGEPVEHAYLGVQSAPITPQVAEQFELDVEHGALILEVARGGPAATAGMAAGDVIVAIDGEPVESVEDMLGILRRSRPGQAVQVTVVRDGEEQAISVELGQRPAS